MSSEKARLVFEMRNVTSMEWIGDEVAGFPGRVESVEIILDAVGGSSFKVTAMVPLDTIGEVVELADRFVREAAAA